MRPLALVLAAVALAAAVASVPRAQAQGGVSPTQVIQFVNLIGGWSARNKVYREANAYTKEVQAGHDKLRETARKQLLDRKITGSASQRSQVAAYVKLVSLIERERTSSIELIESEKRGARAQFHNQLKQTAVGLLTGSSFGRNALGGVRTALAAAKGDVDLALAGGSGAGQVLARLQSASKTLAAAGLVTGVIGGPGGKRVSAALQKTADRLGQPGAALADVSAQLDEGLAELDRLQGVRRVPRGGTLGQDAVVNIVDGGNLGDALSEALGNRLDPQMIAALAALGKTFGPGEKTTMRQRVREQLERGATGRCAPGGNRYRELARAILAKTTPPDPGCKPIDVDALAQELAEGSETPTTTSETTTEEEDGGDSDVVGRWTGTFAGLDAEGQTVTANEITLDVAQDGTGGEIEFSSNGDSTIGTSVVGKNCFIVTARFPPDLVTDLDAGTLSGSFQVSLYYEIQNGCSGGATTKLQAKLTAKITGGTMKGTVVLGGELSLPFTATKTG